MQVVINHLTRMNTGYMCVAGLDLKNGKHVRPVLGGRLGVELLRKNGGVFEIGAMVDLGPVRLVGTAPEVEDRQFTTGNLKVLGILGYDRHYLDSDIRRNLWAVSDLAWRSLRGGR
jgi:hypothetical protein